MARATDGVVLAGRRSGGGGRREGESIYSLNLAIKKNIFKKAGNSKQERGPVVTFSGKRCEITVAVSVPLLPECALFYRTNDFFFLPSLDDGLDKSMSLMCRTQKGERGGHY